jgi:hypothetical protein
MREARQRLATEVAAEQAAKNQRLLPADDWERRIDQARAAVAPAEGVAFHFIPREGGFQMVAITEKDLEVLVSTKSTLGWPKV